MLRNWIRVVAVVLIAFPEPVTTVLGVLILSATMTIRRQSSLRKFGDPENLIKKSFRDSKPMGISRHFSVKQVGIKHVLKQNLPSRITSTSETSGIASSSMQNPVWFDNRKISEAVLHHTLKTSFPQYEAVTREWQEAGSFTTRLGKSEPEKIHHKLKLSLFPDTTSGSLQGERNK